MSGENIDACQPNPKMAESRDLGSLLWNSMNDAEDRAKTFQGSNEWHLWIGVAIGLSAIVIWVVLIAIYSAPLPGGRTLF